MIQLPLPERPFFGSGPCVKPKEWKLENLSPFLMGRSHRSKDGLLLLETVISGLRSLLEIPSNYLIALTPGSATGAMEMALWNFLGPRTVDSVRWDVFSALWTENLAHQLKVPLSIIEGSVPGVLQEHCPDHDLVFTWSGTTHGVWVGETHWIAPPHSGLVLCDATSTVLTTLLPWELLDVTAFSWQKALGGEAAWGVLVLSPKAMERLESYTPSWPVPRLLRLKEHGVILSGIFRGETINTPSLLLAQEALWLLELWHRRGGQTAAITKTQQNFSLVESWCHTEDWVDFLVSYPPFRAKGPVCLQIIDPLFRSLSVAMQWEFLAHMGRFLAEHRAGFEVVNHIRSVPSLRLWCGPNMESEDLMRLFPWLKIAFFVAQEKMGGN